MQEWCGEMLHYPKFHQNLINKVLDLYVTHLTNRSVSHGGVFVRLFHLNLVEFSYGLHGSLSLFCSSIIGVSLQGRKKMTVFQGKNIRTLDRNLWEQKCNWRKKSCLTPATWTPLFKSLEFNKSTEFLSISMGTICTWQRAKALQWRRAVREAVCRQAAGDVSASWMPPHALCPWIYGCAAIGPDPPPTGGQRAPWCPVQLASWSCSGLPPTSWKG